MQPYKPNLPIRQPAKSDKDDDTPDVFVLSFILIQFCQRQQGTRKAHSFLWTTIADGKIFG